MCGIAGFVGLTPDPDLAHQWLRGMTQRIVHRGPDGAGTFVRPDGAVALGMRRLAVIDVAGGQQPCTNERGTLQVVFNGEIYNFRALRQTLEAAGHRFTSHSDTEVIVHGYEEWGEAVVNHLRGMFAFALWDEDRQSLMLARDRFGIKPLYLWSAPGGGLAFASELKSLRALPNLPATISTEAILRYLALGYVPDPLSVLEGVGKLLPGHWCRWAPGQAVEQTAYWHPADVPEQTGIEAEEAIREVRRRLEDAVRCHLESDVPLGAFLSGGIDSAAVVAQMARLTDRPVKTFTIGFDEPGHNEAPGAAEVARALNTDHTELVMRPDADGLLEELVLWFDEPFADSSALPTYLVSQLARQQVTVSLSGDGGDELFGGYTRYRAARRGRRIPSGVRHLAGQLGDRLPAGTRGRGFLQDLGRSAEARFAATVAFPLPVRDGGVVRAELASQSLSLDALLSEAFRAGGDRDLLSRMTLVDTVTYLPGDILTKVDRMSMRVSLEARVPLLDHEFAEFALSLPSGLKEREGQAKWVFREAIRPLLPPSVFTRPKHGFSIPLSRWLQGPLRHRLTQLLDSKSPLAPWVDREAVHQLVTHVGQGRRSRVGLAWRLVVLDLWLRQASA